MSSPILIHTTIIIKWWCSPMIQVTGSNVFPVLMLLSLQQKYSVLICCLLHNNKNIFTIQMQSSHKQSTIYCIKTITKTQNSWWNQSKDFENTEELKQLSEIFWYSFTSAKFDTLNFIIHNLIAWLKNDDFANHLFLSFINFCYNVMFLDFEWYLF